LLIYKFEAFEMFKRFLGKLNDDIVSFISKSDLPKQNPEQVAAAQSQQKAEPRVTASKEEVASSLGNPSGQRAAIASSRATQSREPVKPRKSDKTYGRNDKVTVKYVDGKVKKDVKYKSIEQDLSDAKCIIIEN
jgi:preprotein translocase subunit SecA